MAPSRVLEDLQNRVLYEFRDHFLLEKIFVAGDTNGDDREGHRGMAQLGDSLIGTVMLIDGLRRGLSRSKSWDE